MISSYVLECDLRSSWLLFNLLTYASLFVNGNPRVAKMAPGAVPS
jgi:hypothetical protein